MLEFNLGCYIHGGKCGSHSSSRTLVGKAFRHGFYWPTALQDAAELVRSCKACQFHAKQIHTPAQALQMIPPSWPFAVWGVDILGPFPRAVDRFTKWQEVTPLVNITKKLAVAFLKSIVCRFGVPNRIIADNGTQFKKQTLPRVLQGHRHPAMLCVCGTSPKQWTGRESEGRGP